MRNRLPDSSRWPVVMDGPEQGRTRTLSPTAAATVSRNSAGKSRLFWLEIPKIEIQNNEDGVYSRNGRFAE
jgi:hypothetical protein